MLKMQGRMGSCDLKIAPGRQNELLAGRSILALSESQARLLEPHQLLGTFPSQISTSKLLPSKMSSKNDETQFLQKAKLPRPVCLVKPATKDGTVHERGNTMGEPSQKSLGESATTLQTIVLDRDLVNAAKSLLERKVKLAVKD